MANRTFRNVTINEGLKASRMDSVFTTAGFMTANDINCQNLTSSNLSSSNLVASNLSCSNISCSGISINGTPGGGSSIKVKTDISNIDPSYDILSLDYDLYSADNRDTNLSINISTTIANEELLKIFYIFIRNTGGGGAIQLTITGMENSIFYEKINVSGSNATIELDQQDSKVFTINNNQYILLQITPILYQSTINASYNDILYIIRSIIKL